VPTVERSLPCIALRWRGKVILWDVGECCQRELMKEKIGYGSIEHIFISHLHLDHFLGMYGLIETLRLVAGKDSLHIHGPKGLEDLLINRWPFLRLHTLGEGYRVPLEGAEVRAFPVRHGQEAYGFVFEELPKRKFLKEKAHSLGIKGRLFRELEEKGLVEVGGRVVELEEVSYLQRGVKVVYSGDTRYSPRLVEEARGADVLIHEATFHSSMEGEARRRGHSTAEEAGRAAEEAGVGMLVLTHISPRYKGREGELVEDARRHFKGPVVVAHDGLRLTLPLKPSPEGLPGPLQEGEGEGEEEDVEDEH